MRKSFLFIFSLCLFLFLILICNPVKGSVSIIQAPKDTWTCYDYSISCREKTGLNCVTMSDNYLFHGISHMVNYEIDESGKNITIHDTTPNGNLYQETYTIYNFRECGIYFHFWNNTETPLRRYRFLIDNSNMY